MKLKKTVLIMLTLCFIVLFSVNTYAAVNVNVSFKTDSTKNTTVYSDEKCTKKIGTIYPSDKLRLLDIIDRKSSVKVSYPVTKTGKQKVGYIRFKDAFHNGCFWAPSIKGNSYYGGGKLRAKKKITTFSRYNCKEVFGAIYPGDYVYYQAFDGTDNNSKGYVLYPVSKGYKLAWVRRKDLFGACVDISSGWRWYKLS